MTTFLSAPPAVDLVEVQQLVGLETFRRGRQYAASQRVLRYEWNPDSGSLVGAVDGSGGRTYNTLVRLTRWSEGIWRFNAGRCTCPMQVNCKHVAALLIVARESDALSEAPNWRRSLSALLPQSATATHTPLALELSVPPNAPFAIAARLVRPGARGGWVAGDLSWHNLDVLRYYGHDPRQVHALRALYSLSQDPGSQPANRYAGYSYGVAKTLPLSDFPSPQLWPLLDELRRTGVRLVQARSEADVPSPGTATICLDATAADDGGLTVAPAVEVDGVPRRAAGFIGRSGHGIAYFDDGLRLARLPAGAPDALQHMVLRDVHLAIPAAEIDGFAAEYFPRLRSICTVTSSDGSFELPEIVGPTLVVHAHYRKAHGLDLTCYWSYRIGDAQTRARVDAADDGYRDLDAEHALAADIDAPLELFGIRRADGSLTPQITLGGLDTMRFATELAPLLAGAPGVVVEVSGTPADYREAGESLTIKVSTSAVKGETDWFDLGVTVSVEGQTVAFTTLFTALAAGHDHLLLPDGAYFSLNKPELVRLRNLIMEARALTDDEDVDVERPPRITRFQADLFDELAELGVVVRQAREWKRQIEGLRSLGTLAPIPVPTTLQAELRPYQQDGFSWLATLYTHRLGGILADDMGLGKTVETIALICHSRSDDPQAPPFLVVAPASVMSNWATEIERFAPHLNAVVLTDTAAKSGIDLDERVAGADVVITSYTLFRLDFDRHDELAWSGLILDEAQYVKNRQAKTYQCARRLAAPIKLAITGTPMENNLMELWSLLSITAPGLFPNPKAFADYYAKQIEKGRDTDRLGLLRRRIKPLVLRRTKDLVAADLPPKQDQIVEVDLVPRHRKIYDKRLQRERQKILGLLDDMQRNRFTILKSLTTMRQLALHPGLVDPTAAAVPSAKIELLIEQMVDVVRGGHRALVFSQFTRFLGQVRDRLDAEGIEYCYLDGRTRNRAKAIAAFKDGDAPVFLISLKAGGFGLNLTEADYCFLLDPWWNPAVEAQAVDRTHRIGQTRNVMVYRLIARDTIEEKVVALNARKAALFSSVIDDGDVFGAALTAEDIRELIS